MAATVVGLPLVNAVNHAKEAKCIESALAPILLHKMADETVVDWVRTTKRKIAILTSYVQVWQDGTIKSLIDITSKVVTILLCFSNLDHHWSVLCSVPHPSHLAYNMLLETEKKRKTTKVNGKMIKVSKG